jgi:hypothetical protein
LAHQSGSDYQIGKKINPCKMDKRRQAADKWENTFMDQYIDELELVSRPGLAFSGTPAIK